jgi:glycosyl transferase family 25
MSLPPVFVINLDKSTERMAKISKRLDELKVPFERVSAVYGADLSQEEIDKYYCPELNKKNYRRPLGLGEIGCYMSHLKVWQAIVDRKISCAIILEDDIQLGEDFKLISGHLNTYSSDFDMVKLYAKKSNPKILTSTPITQKHHLCVLRKIPIATPAQLVSHAGAKKLISSCSKFGRPVDVDIQHWWEADLKIFTTIPSVVTPIVGGASDIEEQGFRKGSTSFLGRIKNISRRIKHEISLRSNNQDTVLPKIKFLDI